MKNNINWLIRHISHSALEILQDFNYLFEKILILGDVDENIFQQNLGAHAVEPRQQRDKISFFPTMQPLFDAKLTAGSYDAAIVNLNLDQGRENTAIISQLWECYRLLKNNSLAIICFFGAPSLNSIKQALISAELALDNRVEASIKVFPHPEEITQKMRELNFKNIAVSGEKFKRSYSDLFSLFTDLRAMHCLNSTANLNPAHIARLAEKIHDNATVNQEKLPDFLKDLEYKRNSALKSHIDSGLLLAEWEVFTIIAAK